MYKEKLGELSKQIGLWKQSKLSYTTDEINNIKSEYENLKNKLKTEHELNIIKYFNNMKPFNNIDDIPNIPIVSDKIYNEVIIPNLIRCGAIPKKDLIIGQTYIGDTRNACEAIWDGNKFIYKRYKFGAWFDDHVNHFEDDNGYALFVPIKIKENEKNIENN